MELIFVEVHLLSIVLLVIGETCTTLPSLLKVSCNLFVSSFCHWAWKLSGDSNVGGYFLFHNAQLYNLVFTGPLSSPENVHLNKLNNSSFEINWSPPYSTRNNESRVMQVDPRITQYTVYIIDNNTGDTVHVVNVTETHYTIRSNALDDGSCPMYSIRVTAWNSGGEGGMSGPVYPPQSELTFFYNYR